MLTEGTPILKQAQNTYMSNSGHSDYSVLANHIIGTLAFAPPEQRSPIGEEIKKYSDIYSFGATMLYLFTTKKYSPENINELDSSFGCDNILKRCLEENPENRPTLEDLEISFREWETIARKVNQDLLSFEEQPIGKTKQNQVKRIHQVDVSPKHSKFIQLSFSRKRNKTFTMCLIVTMFIALVAITQVTGKKRLIEGWRETLNNLNTNIKKRTSAFKKLVKEGETKFHQTILVEADLSGIKLERIELEFANLKGAYLQYADLQYAKLKGSILEGAYLQYARLGWARLEGANLQDVNLECADLQYSNLKEVKLQYANLKDTNLEGANLEGANLQYAGLQDAYLLESKNLTVEQILSCRNITGVTGISIPLMILIKKQNPKLLEWWIPDETTLKLEGPYLQGADLRGASLQDADLREADLREADLQGTNLRGANLQDADLGGADLQRAYLQGADLMGADLWGADLQRAYLGGVELRETNLRGANLAGADITKANITIEQILYCQDIANVKGLPKWWNGRQWDEEKEAYVPVPRITMPSTYLEWCMGDNTDIIWNEANSFIERLNISNPGTSWRFPTKEELDHFLNIYPNKEKEFKKNFTYLWFSKDKPKDALSKSYRVLDRTVHKHNIYTKKFFRVLAIRSK